jgi:hypothetical protein
VVTTAFAPILACSPIVTGPRIFAPAPTSTSPQDDTAGDGHLLEQQTVDADPGVRMHDSAVGMRQQQAASDPAVHRNVGAGHNRPAPVFERPIASGQPGKPAARGQIAAN